MNIIYRADYVLPMTDAEVLEHAEVWIENGRIREVGQQISSFHPNVELCDLGKSAILPGFVNAHSHVDPTFKKNFCDAQNLWDWLRELGFRNNGVPFRDLLLASAKLGVAECARSGITCLGDCTISGAAAEAIDSAGLRGVVYKEVFGQSMGENYPEEMARAVDNVSRLQAACSSRLTIGLSPHSVYTSSPEALEYCANTCAELYIPVSMHVAETAAELDYTIHGTGPIADMREECFGYEPMASGLRPVGVLQKAGLLREGVSLAHCVHLNDDEINLLAASGVGIAHCPRSNAYLGGGIAPITKLRQAGATIGLGTDSSASCMRLDFFEEMRFALGLHRAVAEDARVLLAKDVLKLATSGGAEVLGLGDEIGRLESGMRADVIAVDLRAMLLGENVYLSVMSRSPEDVVLRMVNGKLVEPDVESRFTELVDLMEHQSNV